MQLGQSSCDNVNRTLDERPENVVIRSCKNVFWGTPRNGVITLEITLQFNITTMFLEI